MKKSWNCVWIGLLVLLVTEGASAQLGWRDLPPGKWWVNRRVILQLRLNPDQQSRIESLWLQNRRNLMEWKSELEKRQQEFTSLLGKDIVDETAALRAFDRLQEARLSVERATFLMRIQIKNSLTPAQQQKLETMSAALRPLAARGGNPSRSDPARETGKTGNPAPKKSGR
jgi:Spy/CpxP family protein refolding chaperone